METERGKVIDRGKAVMFLIICGDEVLLQERINENRGFAGETIIPGGKNDIGENHPTAAEREIREETGLDGVVINQLGAVFKAITTSGHQYLMQAFYVLIDKKSQIDDTIAENGNLIWVPYEAAKKNQNWAHAQLVFERVEKLGKKG